MISTNDNNPAVAVLRDRLSAGQVAEQMTGRDYLSYSQISTYQACPLKWWYSYVAGAQPEQVSGAMLLGASVHHAIRLHMEAVMAAETSPSVDELMIAYRQNWQEEAKDLPIRFGKDDCSDKLDETARQMLEQFVASPYAQPAGNILGIEETLRMKLADDLPDLLARVDMIEYRDSQLVITDYKTARCMWNPETAEENAEQLVLYGHAAGPMAQELDAGLKLQFVVITKAKTPKVEHLTVQTNPDRVARSTGIIRQVFRCMQSGIVYPAPSKMQCPTCPYQERCKSWHREG